MDCYHLNLLTFSIAHQIDQPTRFRIAQFLKPARVVAVGCSGIWFVDLDSGDIMHRISFERGHFHFDMAYASSGHAIAATSSAHVQSHTVQLFIIDPFTRLERSCALQKLSEEATCVTYAPDDRHLAVGWDDGWLQIIDADSLRVVHTMRVQIEETGYVSCIAYSPSGLEMVVGNADGSLFFVDSASYEIIRTMHPQAEGQAWSCIAFAPDGSQLAAGREGGEFCIVSFPDGGFIRNKPFRTRDARSVAWHPAGGLIAFAPENGSFYIIDAKSGDVIRSVQLGYDVWSVAFSPAGDRLVIACPGRERQDGSLHIYDEDARVLMFALHLPYPAKIAVCSPIR